MFARPVCGLSQGIFMWEIYSRDLAIEIKEVPYDANESYKNLYTRQASRRHTGPLSVPPLLVLINVPVCWGGQVFTFRHKDWKTSRDRPLYGHKDKTVLQGGGLYRLFFERRAVGHTCHSALGHAVTHMSQASLSSGRPMTGGTSPWGACL